MKNHIFRVEKNKNYTVMSNYHLNDNTLSWKAKGLHSYILSKPDNWKVVIEELVKASTDGKTSTRSAMNELYEKRYWQKYPVYINGTIAYWETIIYEVPFDESMKIKNIKYVDNKMIISYENGTKKVNQLLTENQKVAQTQQNQLLTENLKVGFQEVENRTLINTDKKINTDFIKSVSQSKNSIYKETKENKKENQPDGQTDRLNNKIIEQLHKQLNIADLKKCYPNKHELIDEILLNVIEMYFNDYTIIQGSRKPQVVVRKAISMLKEMHIQELMAKFEEISAHTKITNPKSYIQTMIYNLAFENKIGTTNKVINFLGY